MATKSFKLNDTGDNLTLSYNLFFNHTKIAINGTEIGFIADRAAFKEGREFITGNGSKLFVKLHNNWYSRRSEIHILLNGKPVKGSMADPMMQVNRIFTFMLIIGGISVISGLSVLDSGSFFKTFDIDQISKENLSWATKYALVNLIIGSGFVILAFATKKLNLNAVYMAMALLAISISLRISISIEMGHGAASIGLLLRLIYIRILWRGAEAIKEIKKEQEESHSGSMW